MQVELIPILNDNYVFAIEYSPRCALVVDPGDAKPVQAWLQGRRLSHILITHHHQDHVGGVLELKKSYLCEVCGPKDCPYPVEKEFRDGDLLSVGPLNFQVLHLPGHTLDHIAWYEPHHGWLFSGDVLFGLGCGRIFEGTLEQAHSSLHRIKQLPPQTKVFCTHEYTEKNLGFCKTFGLKVQKEYEQKILRLRQNSLPTVPLLLSEELASNPFLLTSELRAFGQLRQSRNIF